MPCSCSIGRRKEQRIWPSTGAVVAASCLEIGSTCDVISVVVPFDSQLREVVEAVSKSGKTGSVIVVGSCHHPSTIISVARIAGTAKMTVLDAPVSFGRRGVEARTAALTVGGLKEDLERARPVLECFSNQIFHAGPIGTGMVAKIINQMLHWTINLANQEALLLGKVYGLDPLMMRDILLSLPAQNSALERWDGTQYTWHQKDMDIALDLAQERKLPLPLMGLVDQLTKFATPEAVSELLRSGTIAYLGRTYEAAPPRLSERRRR